MSNDCTKFGLVENVPVICQRNERKRVTKTIVPVPVFFATEKTGNPDSFL